MANEKKILVVDDESEMQEEVSLLIAEHDESHQVDFANNGLEALEKIKVVLH